MKRTAILPVVAVLAITGCVSAVHESAAAAAGGPFSFRNAPMVAGDRTLMRSLQALGSLRADRTIYVSQNHRKANDRNKGSRNAPVKTLRRAAELARESLNSGSSTRILISAGRYRGPVAFTPSTLNKKGLQTPLVIQGEGKGKTLISALVSEHLGVSYAGDTWEPVPGRKNVYVHDWPHPQEPFAGPWADDYGRPYQNLAARSELIAVNGRVLMPVNLERLVWVDPDGKGKNTKKGSLQFKGIEKGGPGRLKKPYTFMVASHPRAPAEFRGKIFIRLPDGLSIADAVIEIAPPGSCLSVSRKNNVVVRDISVRHSGGNMLTAGLSITHCRNVVVKNVTTAWNNGCGLGLSGVKNVLVVDVTASDNGNKGISGRRLEHVLFDRLTAARNCWRGLRGGWTGWDTAGFKMGGSSHDILFRDAVFVDNDTGGLWLDVFCTDVLIESLFSYGNRGCGLWLELSHPNEGRYEVRNSVLARNGGTGLIVAEVANVWAHNNIIVDNGTNVKFINGDRAPKETARFGKLRLEGNVVVSHRDRGELVRWDRMADKYMRAVVHTDNTYWFPRKDKGFKIHNGILGWDAYVGYLKKRAPKNGAEHNSKWADPGGDKVNFTDRANPWHKMAAERSIEVPVALVRQIDESR